MNMRMIRFFDPDDPGGGGNEPAKPAVTLDDLVSAFRGVVRETRHEPVVATPATPARDPKAEQAEYDEIKKKANDLAATGDTAGAMEVMWGFVQEQSRRSTRPVEELPVYKSQVETVRRIARSENADAFKRWGSEIEAEVSKLSPEDRLNPASYERAIVEVKSRHHEEILTEDRDRIRNEEREKLRKELADQGYLPPVARGSQGSKRGADELTRAAAALDADERGIADSLGITYERYAARKLDVGERGSPGIQMIDGKIPEPGRF